MPTTPAEIRKILINKYNLDDAYVHNIKNKDKLLNLLSYHENDQPISEKFILADAASDDVVTPKPQRHDVNWTEYILNQLTENEKDQEYPKTCGLCRLLEQEVAPIISIESRVIQAPNSQNNMLATVKTKITLANGEIYEACADAQKAHLSHPYDKHITAIAETRSEGRAYRRALKLTGVVTQEEMIDAALTDIEDKVSKNQLLFLETMCLNDRLNININKLLKFIYPTRASYAIDTFTHSEIIKVIQQLTLYQNDVSKIPNEIKGFDPTWR